ncbi:MAG: methyltransferase dimerization domain-containing protein, partial [Acidobacteriota bacterium]
MQQTTQVAPDLFWDTMVAFQRTAALKAAVDLAIFTNIAAGSTTTAAIASAADSAERGVRILCDSLTVMGFLHKSGSDYSLTDASAMFLDKKSPAY